MSGPFYASPIEAASVGSTPPFFQVLATSTGDRVAAVVVRENDELNPVHSVGVCVKTVHGWEMITHSGNFGDETSLWILADLDDPASDDIVFGIGVYCRRLRDDVTRAKVVVGNARTIVPITNGWIVLVDDASDDEHWNPQTVEIEIDGRWVQVDGP